jgi:hypothetical protein
LEYILFAAYLVAFAWLVTKTRFFAKTGLTKPQLVIIFLMKVIAGIFYGWMGHFYGNFAQMIDTWNYHHGGLQEYQLLASDPHEYFTNLFYNYKDSNALHSFFGSKDSYWNDLKSNVFIKFLSVLDIFSFGHYYVNVIFYSFISLFGPMAFYRVATDVFNARKLTLLVSVFFVPSFFYWSSGLHKEGLLFVGVALILFHIYFAQKEKKWKASRWLGILLGLVILLLLRNFVLALIVPAIIGWVIANRQRKYAIVSFIAVYLVCSVCFFGLRYIQPSLDFPRAVVNKQQAFLQLIGNSSININELEPTVGSFLKNTPQAILLSAARPYPSDVHHLLSLAAATETILLWLLLLLFMLFPLRQTVASKNTIYFCVFFSISLLLAIGFSVNNLGAIVRYRSIVLPFVVTLMVMHTNWAAPGALFTQFKKNNNLTK